MEKLNRDEKRTIVMVLHDINQVARFSDYIIAMKNGVVVEAGNSEEIANKNILHEVYNINAYIDKDSVTGKPICLTYALY